jgi:pyruvate/2-oxoglutarate dehydrogenase complex dihydrolipoamide acyltransferase (E2) component
MVKELKVPTFDVNTDLVRIFDFVSIETTEVSKGQIIALFETSKSVLEYESPEAGFLNFLFDEDDEIAPGQIFGIISDSPEGIEEYLMNKSSEIEIGDVNKVRSTSDNFELSRGARMEIEKAGINEKDFVNFLYSNESYNRAISRKEVKNLLIEFKQNHKIETSENELFFSKTKSLDRATKSTNKNLRNTWNNTVPLWVNAQLEADELLIKYLEYAEKNQLAGTMTELVIWGAVELMRTNDKLSGFIGSDGIYHWNEKACAIVVKQEDGVLLLPTIKANKKYDPAQIADLVFDLKRGVVTKSLEPENFSGGGLVVSILENSWLTGFNAIPAPHTSFALAISGPHEQGGSKYISITLTYDHCYVDGNDASSILLDYVNILKNSDKFYNVDC